MFASDSALFEVKFPHHQCLVTHKLVYEIGFTLKLGFKRIVFNTSVRKKNCQIRIQLKYKFVNLHTVLQEFLGSGFG